MPSPRALAIDGAARAGDETGMTERPLIRIASDRSSAQIDPMGAELHCLCDGEGRDLLWDGDPAWWTGRAPILFPIVGALAGDAYTLDGRRYALPKHGFARRRLFTLVDQTPAKARLRLEADDDTRAAYPFEFRLDVEFAIAGAGLHITAVVANRGETPMPASFGFHPAFRWPLPYGGRREDCRIVFEHDEPAPIRRLDGEGTLDPMPYATPVTDRILTPADDLFEADAVIFDRLSSRRLRYGPPDGPGLDIAFHGLPQLGVWTRPGAPYLCIEPWAGYADPAGYAGDLRDKPGSFLIAPDGERRFTLSITQEAAR